MKVKKIAYYNEQCVRAGQRCYDEDMIEEESHDLVIFNLTKDNYKQELEYAEKKVQESINLTELKIYRDMIDEIKAFAAYL
jgi:hypothetical protein